MRVSRSLSTFLLRLFKPLLFLNQIKHQPLKKETCFTADHPQNTVSAYTTSIKAEEEIEGVVARIDAKDERDVAGKVWNWE